MSDIDKIIAKIVKFQNACIDFSTGVKFDYDFYEAERAEFLSEPAYKSMVPDWVLKYRYGSQFWKFIKTQSDSYEGRRVFLRTTFDDLADYVRHGHAHPVAISFNEVVAKISSPDEVDALWRKVQQRMSNDPDGAITAARSTLETVMKFILDQRGIAYTDSEDSFSLYRKVGKCLNLSPDGHNEQTFKQILSGVTGVVQGFSSIRNSYGDAHGKGKTNTMPKERHVELAVNLAGTMSTFLLQTHLDTAITPQGTG